METTSLSIGLTRSSLTNFSYGKALLGMERWKMCIAATMFNFLQIQWLNLPFDHSKILLNYSRSPVCSISFSCKEHVSERMNRTRTFAINKLIWKHIAYAKANLTAFLLYFQCNLDVVFPFIFACVFFFYFIHQILWFASRERLCFSLEVIPRVNNVHTKYWCGRLK